MKALLSVWDKSGIVELGKFLNQKGVELISTGGTARELQNAGLPVTEVAEITQQPEAMNGRVKTLDPKIFGGILADRGNASHMKDLSDMSATQIDIVVVNFYPFVAEAVSKNLPLEKAIEFIDIGGPSMIRAAAKNFHSVIALPSSELYTEFMENFDAETGLALEIRRKFAAKVFELTSAYESAIFEYLSPEEVLPSNLNLNLKLESEMRYGENPHQKAGFYLSKDENLPWEQIQGKKLSYNNYYDLEAALNISAEFEAPACAIIKHSNPCGFALGSDTAEAFNRAVETDPVSYFGGIVGFNREVDENTAKLLLKPFLECIVAPAYSDEALMVLKKKKNLRVMRMTADNLQVDWSLKSVLNGYLYQEKDKLQDDVASAKQASKRAFTDDELQAAKLGWVLIKYVKSNGILFASKDQLLGVGAGQTSRVDSVKIAVRKASEAGLNLEGAVMSSDAFFPFADGVEFAAKAGIRAVVQPGGSMRDGEVIEFVDKQNMAMVFTGNRHFLH